VAVGAGFTAQALLRPSVTPGDAALLDALIASPQSAAASRQAAGPVAASSTSDPTAGLTATRGSDPGAPAPVAASRELQLEIRVALLKLSGNPSLSASGPWQISDRDGRVLQRGGAGAGIDAASLFGSQAELWLETTPGQHLLADGRAYAGRLRLLRGDSGVRVINHLPLESYISAVVGGEMPSHWHAEALRAQAVAARSYALAHMARPADDHYHLGDTTRWQNYEGLSAVNERTLAATRATAGVILSYQGGIVESLYAATAQISQEAHGHLGASMSQNGAQEMASRGLPYKEILAHYYRGAALARLQAGAG
jgi:hypothetical protein